MLLVTKCEFRGKDEKITDKGKYYYVNLEDEKGEACKFQVDDFNSCKDLNKGDIVIAYIEYSAKYQSLKVLRVEIFKGVK